MQKLYSIAKTLSFLPIPARLRATLSPDTDIFPPHKAFLAFGMLAGLAFVIINPPFQAPDESAHWWRAIYIANGTIVAGPADVITTSYVTVVRRFHNDLKILIDKNRKLKKEHILSLLSTPLILYKKNPWPILSSDLYNPLPYIPQILTILICQHLSLSPIIISYLCRFSNLFTWLLLVYMAIRISPLFKWIFFLLSLMPMTLQQAASLSADSTVIGISFLNIAYILKLACDNSASRMSRMNYLLLATIVSVGALSKMNLAFTLILFTIPVHKFGNRYNYLSIIGLIIVSVFITAFLWNYSNSWAIATYKVRRIDIAPQANIRFLLCHPLDFCVLFFSTLCRFGNDYIIQFVGQLGWLNMELPHWLLWSYLALIGVVAISYPDNISLRRVQKIVIAIVFTISALLVFIYLWITEAPAGIEFIPGVQGRYFIAISPLFLLLVRMQGMSIPKHILSLAAIISVAATYCITLPALCTRYYGPVIVASISNKIDGCNETILLDRNTALSQCFVIDIPKIIRKSDYEGYLLYKIRTDEDRQLLNNLYLIDKNNDRYTLRENVTTQEKQRAQKILNTLHGFYSTVSKIDILLEPGGGRHVADVVLHLKKSLDSLDDSATSVLKGAPMQEAGWYTFEFHPVKLKIGRPYYIALDSPEAQSWNAVRICVSGSDTYRRGRLHINRKPAMATNPGCPMDIGFKIPIWF